MLTATVTVWELVWTLMAAATMGACGWSTRYFYLRWRQALQDGTNGGALVILSWRVVRNALCTWAALGALVAGVWQMALPPANPVTPVTLGAIFATLSVINFMVVLTVVSVGEVRHVLFVAGMPKRHTDPHAHQPAKHATKARYGPLTGGRLGEPVPRERDDE